MRGEQGEKSERMISSLIISEIFGRKFWFFLPHIIHFSPVSDSIQMGCSHNELNGEQRLVHHRLYHSYMGFMTC
jgi:hypothetical protein